MAIETSLSVETVEAVCARLATANQVLAQHYPGEPVARQPTHTVYGGAHLFKRDAAKKLGGLALRSLQEHAPDFIVFAVALGLPGAASLPTSLDELRTLTDALAADANAVRRSAPAAWLAHTVYARTLEKLGREPVEDLRIDFEDGYGLRPDAEEDGHAVAAALELAAGLAEGTLPPFVGIRIKAFTDETKHRAVRTLDVFVTALANATGGKLPPSFVVTLPKITSAAQVEALAELLDALETRLALPTGALRLELMIETPQALVTPEGSLALLGLHEAGKGRTLAAHLGAYDYTASCDVAAHRQTLQHPACDFARHWMQVAFAQTGLWLSDGATNVLPVPLHRKPADGAALSTEQLTDNRRAVHRAWKLHFANVQHALTAGFYQGWDLHPAQLPVRFAAMHAFFLEGMDVAAERLKNFVEKAARATLVGSVFDDAATGQGLLNFFLRAINSGAITEEEATLRTTLTHEELRSRSFVVILQNRAR